MDFYLCLPSLQMTNTGKCWLTESFKDSSHNTQAVGAVWEGSATKRGEELVIGEKMLKVLTMNNFFSANILRMPIFQCFSTCIHRDVDWMRSVVEEMGFELAAIHKKLAKILNKDCFPFFVRLLSHMGGNLAHRVHKEIQNTNFKIRLQYNNFCLEEENKLLVN